MKELGEYLKDIRESSGVSLEEASHDLEVDKFYLEALEDGNTRGFKDMIETKDILMKYTKYLGADEKEVSDEFDSFLFERTSKIDLDDILKIEKEEGQKKKEQRVYSPYTRPVRLIKPSVIETRTMLKILVSLLILLILLIYILSRPSGDKGPVVELRIRSFYEIEFTK